MTLTQLSAFVLVARLGSVRAAADLLGVTEPAVSRALAALRQHLDDQLVVREGNTMKLTEGGSRLYGIASQMVALGAEAEVAVRTGKGAAAPLRLLVTSRGGAAAAAGHQHHRRVRRRAAARRVRAAVGRRVQPVERRGDRRRDAGAAAEPARRRVPRSRADR
ncbi:hypothetical protein GCM10009557_46280 [Virgisporangium ochraceum]